MAGHSQFANIKHRKGAQDAKRASLFTKLVREIIVSVKTGQADPKFNPRLRAAISAARAKNLPKDRIEAAITKGSQTNTGDDYQEIRYEGYAPGGVAIIVDALTDNRNRTASDVRSTFTKYGGSFGESGSVSYMFDRVGYIEYKKSIASDEEILDSSIEAGAEDCNSNDHSHMIFCSPEELHNVRDFLANKFGDPEEARLAWRPQNLIDVNDKEQAQKLLKFIDVLEENDDVQFVTGNFQIKDDLLAEIE